MQPSELLSNLAALQYTSRGLLRRNWIVLSMRIAVISLIWLSQFCLDDPSHVSRNETEPFFDFSDIELLRELLLQREDQINVIRRIPSGRGSERGIIADLSRLEAQDFGQDSANPRRSRSALKEFISRCGDRVRSAVNQSGQGISDE